MIEANDTRNVHRRDPIIKYPRGKLEKRCFDTVLFEFHFANCIVLRRRQRTDVDVDDPTRKKGRRGRADAPLGKLEGNTRVGRRERAQRPAAAGHFSFLFVPFVRVTWRRLCVRTRSNNQTRGRERPQDSQALSFEYLERCRHILFRPTRKQPASGSLLTKLRRSSTFVSLCLLLAVTRLNNSHQSSRDPSLLDFWSCFGILNQEIKGSLTIRSSRKFSSQ